MVSKGRLQDRTRSLVDGAIPFERITEQITAKSPPPPKKTPSSYNMTTN